MSAGAYEYSQGRSRVLSYVIGAPAASSNTAVHAAVTSTGAAQVVTTGITSPDVPRNVSATAGGTSADIGAVAVTVKGTDMYGNPISETLPAFTAATPGTASGSKAFATVTEVDIPAQTAGATVSVGLGNKFGLPVKLTRNTVLFTFQDDARETFGSATVAVSSSDLASNTIVPVGTPNGTHVYVVDYYNNG